MNITLKGSEHNKLALIFCINNLSYLNAGCSFLRKLCRAQYTWKTFFNLAQGRVSREAFTHTCSGWHLTLGIGSCPFCIFGSSFSTGTKISMVIFSHRALLAAAGLRSVWRKSWLLWFSCLGSSPALWAKHHGCCTQTLGKSCKSCCCWWLLHSHLHLRQNKDVGWPPMHIYVLSCMGWW